MMVVVVDDDVRSTHHFQSIARVHYPQNYNLCKPRGLPSLLLHHGVISGLAWVEERERERLE